MPRPSCHGDQDIYYEAKGMSNGGFRQPARSNKEQWERLPIRSGVKESTDKYLYVRTMNEQTDEGALIDRETKKLFLKNGSTTRDR